MESPEKPGVGPAPADDRPGRSSGREERTASALSEELELLAYQLEVSHQKIEDLEAEATRSTERAAAAERKLAAMRKRKVWRLAEGLGRFRSRLSGIVRLRSRRRGPPAPDERVQGHPEAPLAEDADAKVGLIDVAVHNPILTARRQHAVAEVDPGLLAINGIVLDPPGFFEELKKYRVCLWAAPPGPRLETAVAATATPTVRAEDPQAHRWLEAFARSEVLRARTAHTAMREAFAGAPRDSMETSIAGDSAPSGESPVDVLVVSNRPPQLETIFTNLGRQIYDHARLFLVGHGVEFDASAVADLAEEHGVDLAAVTRISDEVPLGEVFNRGFAQTAAPIVAKMDDDDFYGPDYLSDLRSALNYSGADVTGKWSHYAYLQASNLLVHRFKEFEFRFTELVAISTLFMHRHVLELATFPALPFGSGSVFLRELGARDGKIFAADRWNYLYNRAEEGSGNTYPLSELEILNYAEVVCRGGGVEAVVV